MRTSCRDARQRELLILGAIITCAGVSFYQGKGFDPRRMTAIALLGAALLFGATFAPLAGAAGAGLLVADSLLLTKNGASPIDALAEVVLPGATSNSGFNLGVNGQVTTGSPSSAGSSSSSSEGEIGKIESAIKNWIMTKSVFHPF